MNFIYSAPNALGEKQCNRIIKYFELHPEFHQNKVLLRILKVFMLINNLLIGVRILMMKTQ